MSRWFRAYDDALNDPKVQKLAPHLFKTWFNLLCLANKSGNGVLPAVSDIAYCLRLSDTDAQAAVDELILVGLIDIAPDKSLSPHNWKARQAPSDKSKDRTKKWRSGKTVTAGDRHGDGGVTVGDENGDGLDKHRTDLDTDKTSVPSLSEAAREKSKAKEQGFKFEIGRDGRFVPKPLLTERAGGLGLNVGELIKETEAAKPDNYGAYFTRLCITRLQTQLPGLSEQLIRDALWKKSAEAYTKIILAMTMPAVTR